MPYHHHRNRGLNSFLGSGDFCRLLREEFFEKFIKKKSADNNKGMKFSIFIMKFYHYID